jgi:hypothetical protein
MTNKNRYTSDDIIKKGLPIHFIGQEAIIFTNHKINKICNQKLSGRRLKLKEINNSYPDKESDYLTNKASYLTFTQPPQKKVKQKNTYIMLDEHTGYYKIGYSANPVKRESTLLSMKPVIKLLYVCKEFVEPELHKKYSEYRIRGEWFDLKDQQINEILSEYKFKQHELSNRHIS